MNFNGDHEIKLNNWQILKFVCYQYYNLYRFQRNRTRMRPFNDN